MGGALPTSLGLAVSQPSKRVLCVSGDGDILMSLGSLATIATLQPKNLTIICIDNALYQETGGQKSHTGLGVDLAKVAEGCGFPLVHSVANEEELYKGSSLIDSNIDGPLFILLKVDKSKPPQYSRNWNASEEKLKFRRNLLK